ncbi:Hpt domain-containing protein [Pseudoduganella sp. SL102]|uniref:Hpt domain-containing protein n=1 Tax=Pseudoduganella sp. SL102 TaxID=2995154 RepID=UPI00248B4ED8|nr:Hpt domain-containing protein [Pseudoduganella sp. SL102]WBR99953.1 Hpt domain-containing protein [Pseudoduganella sp. SL102]
MAAPLDPQYRQRLQALSDMFAATIPARMGEIADALAAAGTAPGPQELERLHQALHTVAGSAGSFGFAALGEEARRLEQAVRGQLAGESGWAALVLQIHAYLDQVSRDPKSPAFRAHD